MHRAVPRKLQSQSSRCRELPMRLQSRGVTWQIAAAMYCLGMTADTRSSHRYLVQALLEEPKTQSESSPCENLQGHFFMLRVGIDVLWVLH